MHHETAMLRNADIAYTARVAAKEQRSAGWFKHTGGGCRKQEVIMGWLHKSGLYPCNDPGIVALICY